MGAEPAWPDFVTEAKDYVVGLGLPYPWLVVALLGEFGRRYLADLAIVTCPTSDHGCGEMPWGRLREHQRLEPATASDEALVPCHVRKALRRWAEWFYRREVRGDSIRSIARAAFGPEDDRRKDVRDGIARVKEFSALPCTAFRCSHPHPRSPHYPPPPANSCLRLIGRPSYWEGLRVCAAPWLLALTRTPGSADVIWR